MTYLGWTKGDRLEVTLECNLSSYLENIVMSGDVTLKSILTNNKILALKGNFYIIIKHTINVRLMHLQLFMIQKWKTKIPM